VEGGGDRESKRARERERARAHARQRERSLVSCLRGEWKGRKIVLMIYAHLRGERGNKIIFPKTVEACRVNVSVYV